MSESTKTKSEGGMKPTTMLVLIGAFAVLVAVGILTS